MFTTEIVAPTTSAVAAAVALPITKFPCTITAPGLAGAETALLWFSPDGGSTWEEYAADEGSQITLSATRKTYVVNAPILLGVSKSITVAAVGLYQTNFEPTDNNFD